MSKVTEIYPDTTEGQTALMDRIEEAEKNGDLALVLELNKQLVPPAHILMVMKKVHGPEWVRRMGYKTDEADRKYGHGWLDK
jgi:hypothetical protein